MELHDLTRSLHIAKGKKIIMVVADGLGGLAARPGGMTELEAASTPNLDDLARRGVCGLMTPILPGIAPGSGPGHLALFGYDPLRYTIGRGALEALGIDFDLLPSDVAVRGNFCTLSNNGVVTDRRAGRIATELCVRLVEKLRAIQIEGVDLFVEPVREYRFVLVIRGAGLGHLVTDTDPQEDGHAPLDPRALDPESRTTADVAGRFISRAREILKGESPANMVTLRGFARRPDVPSMREVYGLSPLALAVYPMYRGLARLVGMTVATDVTSLDEQAAQLKARWNDFDFFFLHFKYTDSTGEDGRFDKKVERIEELDGYIPRIASLKPEVLIVTGDHSTPSALRSHSWHPVPVLLVSPSCRVDEVTEFGERYCLRGGLGQFEAKYLMSIALAHAGRLRKFGA